MSELRLILLLIGAGIIVGVYAWTRFQQSSRRSAVRTGPASGAAVRAALDEPDAEALEEQLARMEQLVVNRDRLADETDEAGAFDAADVTPPETPSERLLVISVVAPEGELFEGEAVHRAFRHNKLRHSERGIYERLALVGGREEAVFGIANLVKPGVFEPGNMAGFSTPGVTLFLQLPCAIGALEAFDDFVKTAERLAVEIGGELRDEKREVLTHQNLMLIRESIVDAGFHPGAPD